MDRAYALVIQGVTDDFTPFHDVTYLVGTDDVDVRAAVKQLLDDNDELSLTSLWSASPEAWAQVGLVPADRDRGRFLAAAGQVLPNAQEPFARVEQVLVEMDEDL